MAVSSYKAAAREQLCWQCRISGRASLASVTSLLLERTLACFYLVVSTTGEDIVLRVVFHNISLSSLVQLCYAYGYKNWAAVPPPLPALRYTLKR